MPTVKAKKTRKSATGAFHAKTVDGKQAVGILDLHVLVFPDGKGWFAQAFEIDYGVQGNSQEQVKERFERGLAATIQHNVDIYGHIEHMLKPNQEWYALKAKTEAQAGNLSDFSCVEVFRVSQKLAATFNKIEYETVRPAAA
jgi:hypothetical protein